MRLKSAVFCVFTLLFVLCGCHRENNINEKQQALEVYNLDINFFNEYDVCDLENIYIYFPIVTNKEIISSKPSGVGARFNLKEDNNSADLIKIKLTQVQQDKINIKYNDYYISFLKYKLEFSANLNKNDYNSIDVNDTKIWILCNEEIQPANFNEDYLKINFIQNSNMQKIPCWEQITNDMLHYIKNQFH